MMRRAAALLAFAACLAGSPAAAQSGPSPAEAAEAASVDLRSAIASLDAASGGRAQVAALTETIQAYERGLAALRDGLRRVAIRERELKLAFDAESGEAARLLGVMMAMERSPAPLLLLHPDGPEATARASMVLADLAPALQAKADTLRARLEEAQLLRSLQEGAAGTLAEGLRAAQAARTALSQAISDRTELPRRFTEDRATLNGLLESIDTLDGFAAGLASLEETPGAGDPAGFAAARGRLPLPVIGTVLRKAGEADAAGIRRPGIVIATRPAAIVTAPWPATVRYRGPLLDYGNVMILEPASGYLLVLAGLGLVYGEVGEILSAGAPVGLMGGTDPGAAEFIASAQEGGGAGRTETLYIELRQGGMPVDPAAWFIETKED